VKRGLFGEPCGLQGRGRICFTEASVVRFIRRHPREYNLAKVCRPWFIVMIFERGGKRVSEENRRNKRP
jgi:hypothetical protein